MIDSHTGGEPIHPVIDGFPDLGTGNMSEHRERLSRDHDNWRRAIILKPRDNDVLVGALLCKPILPQAAAGVIPFNNCGSPNMCGHGTIGLTTSLAWPERIQSGKHLAETLVGDVAATLHEDGSVSVENTSTYRRRKQVQVGTVHDTVADDIAWDGNWFFLINDHPSAASSERISELAEYARAIREGLDRTDIRGEHNSIIDHIGLFAEDDRAGNRSFVFCPGKAWDRSPCGTGTSAKLACLAESGKLKSGESRRQTSAIGSGFAAYFVPHGGRIVPTIRGEVWVCDDNKSILNPEDPLCWGISL